MPIDSDNSRLLLISMLNAAHYSCLDFQMIFDLTAKKLIGYEPSKSSESLRKNFVAFIRGLISFPVNIPGTAYHECMEVNISTLTGTESIT
jgi:hypothetical protein